MNITIKPIFNIDLDKYFCKEINKYIKLPDIDEFEKLDINDDTPPTPQSPPNQIN
jgi:hypothetical protein